MTYFLVPRATVVRVEGVPRLEYVESTYRLSKQYKEHIPSTSTMATASAPGATDKDWSRFTLVLMLAVSVDREDGLGRAKGQARLVDGLRRVQNNSRFATCRHSNTHMGTLGSGHGKWVKR